MDETSPSATLEEVAGALTAAKQQIPETFRSTPSSSDLSAPQIHCGQVESSIVNARTVVKDSPMTLNQYATVNQVVHHNFYIIISIIISIIICILAFLAASMYDQNKEKTNLSLSQLIQLTQEVARGQLGDNRALMISKIVQESNDVEVIREVAGCFVGRSMRMNNIPLTIEDFHALCFVIKRIPGPMNLLSMTSCQMGSDAFSLLSKAIIGLKGKIRKVHIRYNRLTNVDDIIKILPKIEEKLKIKKCFDNGHGGHRSANQEERQKLQQALDALENTKLRILVSRDGQDKPVYLYHKDRKT